MRISYIILRDKNTAKEMIYEPLAQQMANIQIFSKPSFPLLLHKISNSFPRRKVPELCLGSEIHYSCIGLKF